MVWHHSLPLTNSFNKTEAAVFSCRLCFLRAFPFISLNYVMITSRIFILQSIWQNYYLLCLKSLFSFCGSRFNFKLILYTNITKICSKYNNLYTITVSPTPMIFYLPARWQNHAPREVKCLMNPICNGVRSRKRNTLLINAMHVCVLPILRLRLHMKH